MEYVISAHYSLLLFASPPLIYYVILIVFHNIHDIMTLKNAKQRNKKHSFGIDTEKKYRDQVAICVDEYNTKVIKFDFICIERSICLLTFILTSRN